MTLKRHDFTHLDRCRRCGLTIMQWFRTQQPCTRTMPLSNARRRFEKQIQGR